MSDHKEMKIENDVSEQGLDSVQPPDNKKIKILEEEEEEDVSLEIEDSGDSAQPQKKDLILQNDVGKPPFRTGNLFGGYDIRGSPVLINGKPFDVEESLKLDNNGREGSIVYQTNDPNTLATSTRLFTLFTDTQANIYSNRNFSLVSNANNNYLQLSNDGNIVLRARNEENDAFVRINQCDLVVDQDIRARGIKLNSSGSVAVISSDNNWLRLINNQSGNYIEAGATQNTMVGNLVCGNGGIGSQSNHIVRLPTGPKGDADDVLAIDSVDGDIVRTKWASPSGEYGPVEFLGDAARGGGWPLNSKAALYCRKSRVDKSRNIYHLVIYGTYVNSDLVWENLEIHFDGVNFFEHPHKVFRSFSIDNYAFIQDNPKFDNYTYHFGPSFEEIDGIEMGSYIDPDGIYILFRGSSTPTAITGNLYFIITF